MSSVVDQGRVGELVGSDGTIQPVRLTRKGALATTDAHGRYQEAVLRGNVYFLTASAVVPTGFTGGAAGTPLIAVMNPAGSGKVLVFLAASTTLTAVPTAAGVVDSEIWAGLSALPTGTITAPTNMATQQATGSASKGFVNAVLTGSTAINLVTGLSAFWWATAAAGAMTSSGIVDLAGIVVATPGVLVA